jgi:hypothetical protein
MVNICNLMKTQVFLIHPLVYLKIYTHTHTHTLTNAAEEDLCGTSFSQATATGDPSIKERKERLGSTIESFQREHQRHGEATPALRGSIAGVCVVGGRKQQSQDRERVSFTSTESCRYGAYRKQVGYKSE